MKMIFQVFAAIALLAGCAAQASGPIPLSEEVVAVTGPSLVMDLDDALVMVDPVGDQAQFRRFGRPDIVVLTQASPEHLSVSTMIGLLRRDTVVLAPQSVIDRLPLMISNNTIAPFDAGGVQSVGAITFRALPAGGSVPGDAARVDRARGDISVVMEVGGQRLVF